MTILDKDMMRSSVCCWWECAWDQAQESCCTSWSLTTDSGLCKEAMKQEEAQAQEMPTGSPAWLLEILFDMPHTFAVLLCLEVLSLQVDALHKGAWGGWATEDRMTTMKVGCIVVDPV